LPRKLRVTEDTIRRARECKVLYVKRTSRRVIGIIQGKNPHVAWISNTGECFCSCVSFQYGIYLCKHLYVLAKLFTDLKVEVIK